MGVGVGTCYIHPYMFKTHPILMLRFEADTPQRLEEIRAEVEAEVKKRL